MNKSKKFSKNGRNKRRITLKNNKKNSKKRGQKCKRTPMKNKKSMKGGRTEENVSNSGKKILLIIDPQNDFTTEYGNLPNGPLGVPGSLDDYRKIVEFLDKYGNNIDEIHVSLDTHTNQHIGHIGFWNVKNDGGEWVNAGETEKFNPLIINGSDKIVHKDKTVNKEFTPRDPLLLEYTKEYLTFYNTPENKKELTPMIWGIHCIEGTEGHKVCPILKKKLDTLGDKVKYHIKGQNNLAEMYSIFKAERPITEEIKNEILPELQSLQEKILLMKEMNNDLNVIQDLTLKMNILNKKIYSGINTIEMTKGGEQSYDKVSKMMNLNTELNTELLEQLLGGGVNTVMVCGEAKTHCVKSSMIDLLDYVKEKGYSKENIILLSDATSPIPGFQDDIEKTVTDNGSKSLTTIDTNDLPMILGFNQ